MRCDTFTSQITCVSVKCPSSSCRVHVISLTMRQNAKSGSGRTTDHRYFMSSLPVRGLLVILPLLKMQRMVKRQGKFRKLGDRALRCAFTAAVGRTYKYDSYNTRNAHLTKFLAARSKLSVQEEKEEETVCTCHCRPRSTTDVGVSSVVHGVASSPKVPRGHSLSWPTSHSPFLPSISSLPHCLALVNVMFPKDY